MRKSNTGHPTASFFGAKQTKFTQEAFSGYWGTLEAVKTQLARTGSWIGGCLMGIMANRNACRGQLILFFVALVVLLGHQSGFSEAQDIERLREAAVQGDACAQSTLGLMYTRGEGVSENDREAGMWFRLAAKQGNAQAQFNLGLMYNKGVGVPESDVEASKWFQLAADQGNAEAQFNLGFMYANGEGVPEDYVKAYIWGNLAAAQGGDRVVKPEDQLGAGESLKFKDWLRKKMTAEQVAEAQKLSVELFNRIESSAPDSPRRDCSSMQFNRLPARPAPSQEPAGKADHEAERMLKESDLTTTLPEPSGLYRVSKEVTSPTVLLRIEPVYSQKAREAKLQGKVVVSAIVRKDGTLEVLKVVRGLGLGLDENAIAALKKWRFRPGMRDGKPVNVALNIEVNFRLTKPVDP